MSVDSRPAAAPAVREWAERVQGQLNGELGGLPGFSLTVLAGKLYRTLLAGVPWPHDVPMEGLGIGQQLGGLTARIAL